jgi:hypothetical protein
LCSVLCTIIYKKFANFYAAFTASETKSMLFLYIVQLVGSPYFIGEQCLIYDYINFKHHDIEFHYQYSFQSYIPKIQRYLSL